MTAHINLIWSPAAFIDTGIEYVGVAHDSGEH
jgi:hypothetical protein